MLEQSQQGRQARRWVEEWGTDTSADTIRELSAPGVVYEETGTGERFEGIDALMTGLRGWIPRSPTAPGRSSGRGWRPGRVACLEQGWFGLLPAVLGEERAAELL